MLTDDAIIRNLVVDIGRRTYGGQRLDKFLAELQTAIDVGALERVVNQLHQDYVISSLAVATRKRDDKAGRDRQMQCLRYQIETLVRRYIDAEAQALATSKASKQALLAQTDLLLGDDTFVRECERSLHFMNNDNRSAEGFRRLAIQIADRIDAALSEMSCQYIEELSDAVAAAVELVPSLKVEPLDLDPLPRFGAMLDLRQDPQTLQRCMGSVQASWCFGWIAKNVYGNAYAMPLGMVVGVLLMNTIVKRNLAKEAVETCRRTISTVAQHHKRSLQDHFRVRCDLYTSGLVDAFRRSRERAMRKLQVRIERLEHASSAAEDCIRIHTALTSDTLCSLNEIKAELSQRRANQEGAHESLSIPQESHASLSV
jgi:hypothetical protein